ncbi:hypothetical protein BD309DRAFT_83648 [Dichomitus squalens]|nr:hypothetical protein BD309DRAFT_83648 [Dichomitus squalens]
MLSTSDVSFKLAISVGRLLICRGHRMLDIVNAQYLVSPPHHPHSLLRRYICDDSACKVSALPASGAPIGESSPKIKRSTPFHERSQTSTLCRAADTPSSTTQTHAGRALEPSDRCISRRVSLLLPSSTVIISRSFGSPLRSEITPVA